MSLSISLSAHHPPRHQSTNPTPTHPRGGGGHIVVQVQAVLQRGARQVRLCLTDRADNRLRVPKTEQACAAASWRSG